MSLQGYDGVPYLSAPPPHWRYMPGDGAINAPTASPLAQATTVAAPAAMAPVAPSQHLPRAAQKARRDQERNPRNRS